MKIIAILLLILSIVTARKDSAKRRMKKYDNYENVFIL